MTQEEKRAESLKMKRFMDVFSDPDLRSCLNETAELEKNREFCRHDLAHLKDTARLAYIFSLERDYGLDKSLVYTAALLHDCGRAEQYKTGEPHDIAGGRIARCILEKYDFSAAEAEMVAAAIERHRGNLKTECGETAARLAEVLYDADKLSRECFSCEASKDCSWSGEKKNMTLF